MCAQGKTLWEAIKGYLWPFIWIFNLDMSFFRPTFHEMDPRQSIELSPRKDILLPKAEPVSKDIYFVIFCKYLPPFHFHISQIGREIMWTLPYNFVLPSPFPHTYIFRGKEKLKRHKKILFAVNKTMFNLYHLFYLHLPNIQRFKGWGCGRRGRGSGKDP